MEKSRAVEKKTLRKRRKRARRVSESSHGVGVDLYGGKEQSERRNAPCCERCARQCQYSRRSRRVPSSCSCSWEWKSSAVSPFRKYPPLLAPLTGEERGRKG